MKKLMLMILPVLLLSACDKPKKEIQLDCTHWNVNAKIYKDKVIMGIVNKSTPYKENDRIPSEFLVKGQKINVVADRFIGVLGDNDGVWTTFEYYKTFEQEQTGDNDDVSNSVGLVFDYDRETQLLSVDGLSFGFTYRYDCKQHFPDVMNSGVAK